MPLKGWETETALLSEHELNVLVPVLAEELRTKVGKGSATKAGAFVRLMQGRGFGTTDVRIRAMIAYISNTDMVSCIVSSSKGFWITDDPDEMRRYEDSLGSRARQTLRRKMAVALQRRELLKTTQETIIIRHEQ